MNTLEKNLDQLKSEAYDLIAKGQQLGRELNDTDKKLAIINNLIVQFGQKANAEISLAEPVVEAPVEAPSEPQAVDEARPEQQAPEVQDLTPAPISPDAQNG